MKDNNNSAKKGHNHMKMMPVCCGVPIVLAIAVSVIGINSESLDTLILLMCPVMMVGMMFMMNKKGEKSRGDPEEKQEEKPVQLLSENNSAVETGKSI